MARPEPKAHTVCEIVLHMTTLTREVTRRQAYQAGRVVLLKGMVAARAADT